MRPLSFPVNLSGREAAELAIDELRLASILGPPHRVSEESAEFPGPVKLWAYELDDGTPLVVEAHPLRRVAYMVCDPAKLDLALSSLGLPASLVTWRVEQSPPEPSKK